MAPKATKNKPVAIYRLGSISLALFEYEIETSDTSFISRKYIPQKSYKDEKNVFHNISSFTLADLVVLRQLISNAIADGMISAD